MENSEHVEKYYDVLYVLDSEIEHKICRFSFRYLKRMIQKKKKFEENGIQIYSNFQHLTKS